MEKHKCAECGFLAARSMQTRGLEEVEQDFREKGKPQPVFDQRGFGGSKYEILPICFVMEFDLVSEFKKFVGPGQPSPDNVCIILNKNRTCNNFIKYQQGFTPKEQQEMLNNNESRRWRIYEALIFAALAGLFTLLGAWISKGS